MIINSRLAVFLFLMFSLSCASDHSNTEDKLTLESVLPGDWHLIEAHRNEKLISTLQGVYFNFDSLGNVSTNLSGQEIQTKYQLEEDSFSYLEAGESKNYQTRIVSADTINIATKIQIFDFNLLLARGK